MPNNETPINFNVRKKAFYSFVEKLTLQNIEQSFFENLEFAGKLADPGTAYATLAKKCFDLYKAPQNTAEFAAKLKSYAYLACDAIPANSRHFPATQLIMGKIVLETCTFNQSSADREKLARAITHLLRSTDKGQQLGLEMLDLYSGTPNYTRELSLIGIEKPGVMHNILQLADIAYRRQQNSAADKPKRGAVLNPTPAATPAPLLASYNAQPKKSRNPLHELLTREFTWEELLATAKLEGSDLNEVDPKTGDTIARQLFLKAQSSNSPSFLGKNFLRGLFQLGAKPNSKWWAEEDQTTRDAWGEVTWEQMKDNLINLTTDGKPAP